MALSARLGAGRLTGGKEYTWIPVSVLTAVVILMFHIPIYGTPPIWIMRGHSGVGVIVIVIGAIFEHCGRPSIDLGILNSDKFCFVKKDRRWIRIVRIIWN